MSKLNVKSSLKSWTKAILITASVGGLLFASGASAAAVQGKDLQTIKDNMQNSVGLVANILVMLSTIAGIGFIMASFFKFHQHKMNPQQTPMSQGITLVIIGAAMVVFPYLLQPVSQAVFGNKVAQISGKGIDNIINGSGGS